MPATLPSSSTPVKLDRFHSPARSEAAACGTLRATASSSADRVLGGAHDVGRGGVHHHHAGPGGRVHVDVVEADPGAGDDPQPRGMGERLRIDLGGAADDDRVGAGERGEQRGAVRAIRVADLEVGFQLRDGGR